MMIFLTSLRKGSDYIEKIIKNMPLRTELRNHPKIIFDLPPGGLWTFTEVLAVCVVEDWLNWFWGASGWTVGLTTGLTCFGLTGSVSQAREKVLFPPGAWWTLTEVVPSFVKSILFKYKLKLTELFKVSIFKIANFVS